MMILPTLPTLKKSMKTILGLKNLNSNSLPQFHTIFSNFPYFLFFSSVHLVDCLTKSAGNTKMWSRLLKPNAKLRPKPSTKRNWLTKRLPQLSRRTLNWSRGSPSTKRLLKAMVMHKLNLLINTKNTIDKKVFLRQIISLCGNFRIFCTQILRQIYLLDS